MRSIGGRADWERCRCRSGIMSKRKEGDEKMGTIEIGRNKGGEKVGTIEIGGVEKEVGGVVGRRIAEADHLGRYGRCGSVKSRRRIASQRKGNESQAVSGKVQIFHRKDGVGEGRKNCILNFSHHIIVDINSPSLDSAFSCCELLLLGLPQKRAYLHLGAQRRRPLLKNSSTSHLKLASK
jgi:hypothetical protein